MIHKLSQNAIEYAGKTVRKTAKKAGKNIGKTSTSTQRAIVYAPTYQPIVRKGTYSRFKEDVLDISKPATTIERANRIAQAMGVGELRISDLGLANYINKGLYEYTRITKKKLPKIDIITENPVGECNSRAIMSTGIYNGKRFIYANKNQLIRNSSHNMGFYAEDLRDILYNQDSKLTPAQRSYIKKALSDQKNLTPEEERAIWHVLSYSSKAASNAESCYISLLNSPDTRKIAKKAKIPIVSLSNFRTFSKKEKNHYIENLLNAGCKMSYDSHGQYHALFHELGHIHHENKIGSRRLNKMYTGFDTELLKTSSSPYVMESTNRFASKQKNHLMASYLSQYAMTCPGEFIAEMYAGTLDGNSYCKELKKMYRRYHGPNIPLFTKLRNFIMTKIN